MPALPHLLRVGMVKRGAGNDVVNVPVRAVVAPRHAALKLRFKVTGELVSVASNKRRVPLTGWVADNLHNFLEAVTKVARDFESGVADLACFGRLFSAFSVAFRVFPFPSPRLFSLFFHLLRAAFPPL